MHQGPAVKLPDKRQIHPTHQGLLPLSTKLSEVARTATVLPQLSSSSLLSTGKICDDNNMVIFDKNNVRTIPYNRAIATIVAQQDILLQGKRNPVDSLYDVTIRADPTEIKTHLHPDNFVPNKVHPSLYSTRQSNHATRTNKIYHQLPKKKQPAKVYPENIDDIINQQLHVDNQHIKEKEELFTMASITNPQLNVILRKDKPHQELVTFLHGACFSPVVSTFIRAIDNGHFISWPGLTSALVRKHLNPSLFTAKGHLNQERQGIQSTKNTHVSYKSTIEKIRNHVAQLKKNLPTGTTLEDAIRTEIIQDSFPSSDSPNIKTKEVLYAMVDSNKDLGYMDLTGRFPYKSSRGNEYILISYNYDGNTILAEPLKIERHKPLSVHGLN